jgi:hypothetical protein
MEQQNDEQTPKPKGFVAPKPGAHPIKQKVVMHQTPGEEGMFVHDEGIPRRFAVVAAKRLHAVEEKVNNDPQDYDTYEERMYRMVCLLMARKLAVSLSDQQGLHSGGHLRGIARMANYAPSGFIPFIDHFGSVESEKMKFSMAGQPLLAFSYFCRAVEDDMPNRLERLTVNAHWPDAKRMLFEFAKSIVTAWAENAPHHQFAFAQGVNVVMSVPKPGTGLRGYSIFVAAVPKSNYVRRMIEIAALIEPFINAQLTPVGRDALLAEHVVFVDWNSALITEMGAGYERNVESRLRMSLSKATNWVQVSALKATGSGSQLLVKLTEHMFYCGHMLGGDVLTLGWMVAASGGLVVTNQHAFYVIPDQTSQTGMTTYVEQMMKI